MAQEVSVYQTDQYSTAITNTNEFSLKTVKDNDNIIMRPLHENLLIERQKINSLRINCTQNIRIINSKIENISSIIKEKPKLIEFQGGKYKNIDLNQHVVAGIENIDKNYIKKINIKLNGSSLTLKDFNNLDELILSFNHKENQLELINVTAKNICLYDNIFKDKNRKITFRNVRIGENGLIQLTRISCPHFEFLNCDFSEAILKYDNSTIEKISSINVKWFEKIIDEHNNEIREFYRHFKTQMINQNDRINELYFKSKELNAYRKTLKKEGGSLGDRTILLFNKLTNNFGASWISALICILVEAIIFFIIYYYSTTKWQIGKEHFWCYIEKLAEFINPIHKFELFGEGTNKPISYFIDAVHRIFNYFFYYQFVAAFRKFGRS